MLESTSIFRPDPDRGVYLNDLIGPELLKKLTPEVLGLQAKSRGAITLYIDSFGGNTFYARTLRELLRSPNQDGVASHLITVATGFAASSAADLLVAGNYAIAYQHARIICHGNRREDHEITHERALSLAKALATSNEEFALQYANDCFGRLIFRYCGQISKFAETRTIEGNGSLTDLECFLEILRDKVPPQLQFLLRDAFEQSTKSETLDKYASEKLTNETPKPRIAEFEVELLKTILDFELETNPSPNWSIRSAGMGQIEEKFELLVDRHRDHHREAIAKQCLRWREYFLAEEEQREWENSPNEERIVELIGKSTRA